MYVTFSSDATQFCRWCSKWHGYKRLYIMTNTQAAVLLQHDDLGDLGRIARVTFNRPEQKNAIDQAGKELFVDVMTSIRQDRSLRAVILTGAGNESFVGGTDIGQMAQFNFEQAERSAYFMHRVCDVVRTCPVPVIARINGYCFGSGMEIAACADLRVAADHAKFGMPEVRFGVPAGMEAAMLPRLIGWGKAREIMLTGDSFSAQDAYAMGYLQKVVPFAQMDEAVDAWIKSLSKCGLRALRLQKRNMMFWEQMSLTDAARAGINTFVDAYDTDEPRQMMMAFVSRKRKAS